MSCTSSKHRVSNVRIAPVEGSKESFEVEHRRLKAEGCKYIRRIEVTADNDPGNSTQHEQFMMAFTNKAEQEGGNTVITAFKAQGEPAKTKGLMYSCPVKH